MLLPLWAVSLLMFFNASRKSILANLAKKRKQLKTIYIYIVIIKFALKIYDFQLYIKRTFS